ncbi:hypothetical protein FCIRC_9336 [Fusarium circinatum]|uniref:Uncharacterized protein n=1 Tax=Fusarium circinatum TaxID=48490 RepID=A0A8H5TFV4_FUSCI|nr:hypothetical protein FCIRC_9336 [Fusarium circinatum]
MLTTPILTLILSIFANRVLCDTKFLRPPEWNSDVDDKTGFGKNIQYSVGDTIQLLWETDLDKVELYLVQRIGSVDWDWILDSSRTEWQAEWDVLGILEGNEDSVYYFALSDRPDGLTVYLAETQYFNVTAPKLETAITSTLQTSTTIESMSSTRIATSTTKPLPTSAAPDQSLDSDAKSNSDFGISKGEIAGAAVGGTIGGLILVGVVGWFIWRRGRRGRRKEETDLSIVSQSHQQQFHSSETKAELPGDPVVEGYPSGLSPPIMQLDWVFLLVASLASLAACKIARFIDPPPWNHLDDGFYREFDNNRRYKHGENVSVRLSDGHVAGLSVWQLNPVNKKKGKNDVLESTKTPGRYVWRARYDMGHYLENGEDAVYWLEMRGLGFLGKDIRIRSTFFNVSMPDSFERYLPAASKTTSLARVSPTSKSTKQPSAESTATEEPSREEEKSSTRSGLAGPQVAGIAIGAVVAFILMVAGFCWGFERMRVARQLQRSHEFELRNMERDVRALRETVSKLGS